MDGAHFVVRRDRLSEHEMVTSPRGALAPGDAELRVDTFGLTANNVTYALRGDALSYWKFFPDARAGWGRIPVWGFGTVVRTAADGVSVGERFYGYFSMSSHVVVQPKRVDAAGFFDGSPHRRDLSAVYNHYVRTTRDPSYHPDTEPQQVVLRPLFGTAFFLADYLREYGFFDAEVTLVSSASSKLACGIAFSIAADAKRDRRKVVGLTSERHAAFVQRLGLFERVITYSDLAALPTSRRAVYVDIAGSSTLRAAIHQQFGRSLRYSLAVGSTHQDALGGPGTTAGLPGPEPVPFFAPAWIRHRNEQWTPEGVRLRLGEAWRSFLVPMLDPARNWMTIASGSGPEAVARTYQDVFAGRAPADQGHVLSLSQGV
jgi:Protein of unknown function (DUF2855)